MFSSDLETPEWEPTLDKAIIDSSEPEIINDGFICIEKRRNIRKPATWSAEGQWDNGIIFEALTDNVSISGIMIITKRSPKIGDRAMLKVNSYMFGQSFAFTVLAEVKHICLSKNMYYVGMQFTKTTREGQNFIRDFVSNRNPHSMRKRRARIAKEAANN